MQDEFFGTNQGLKPETCGVVHSTMGHEYSGVPAPLERTTCGVVTLVTRIGGQCGSLLGFDGEGRSFTAETTGTDCSYDRSSREMGMRRERVQYKQRFGKTLDEDVKIGDIVALAPSQVQNHCHLNSHTLKSYGQVRAMLFDYCRAQTVLAFSGVVLMDLSMLGKGKGKKRKGDGKDKGQGATKDREDTDEERKGNG